MSEFKEPPPGSVVLLHGATGTAAQRFFSDGLWRVMGRPKPYAWDDLLLLNKQADGSIREPLLIHYTAPVKQQD